MKPARCWPIGVSILDIKTLRQIAYRYGARARLSQQMDDTVFEDTVAGRRVVVSSDGGRIRLRETKRGRKTKEGSQALYRGVA